MRYIFNHWDGLKKRLRRARCILLCVDFDGTIAPIKPRPKEAVICRDIQFLLRKFSKHKSFIVGIISGRTLKDIKKKIGIKGLIFVGNHGLEIAYKKKRFVYPGAERYVSVISQITRSLKKRLGPFSGAVLEDKGLSFSLHYRLVKKDRIKSLKKIFLQIISPYLTAQKIKLTSGKKVWEVRPPVECDKGKAFLLLAQRFKSTDAFNIYIGDDTTDEDAFRAVNKIGGLSIRVGRKKGSLAQYYLKNVVDTQRLLERILELKCEE